MTTLDRARRALAGLTPVALDDEPGARRAAVALILHEGTRGLEGLFIRRAARAGDPWSGQVAFPGGGYEDADRELRVTAIRETREETGVDLTAAELLGRLDDLHPRTPTLPPVVVRPFVFALVRVPPLVPSEEVERAFWLPFARLTEPGVRRDVTLTHRGAPRVFPAYDLGDDVIWGMTERMLTPFLARIGVFD